MIIKPYDKIYLEDVADNLGKMLEYSIGCQFNPKVIWEMFVSSKVAMEIEKGNPKYISGYSARNYLDIVVNTAPVYDRNLSDKIMSVEYKVVDDRYYWGGSVLAQLQNEMGLSFYNINKYFPFDEVLELYDILHEADIKKFFEIARNRIRSEKPEANLKIIRKASGMTQKELAVKSMVEIRSIQMYEQKKNDINKAQAETLYKLSKILGCQMEALLEIE